MLVVPNFGVNRFAAEGGNEDAPTPTWVKYASNPVLPAVSTGFFSDAAVINDGGVYKAAISGELAASSNGNCLLLYTSTDRRAWTAVANGAAGIIAQGTPSLAFETPGFIKASNGEYLILCDVYNPATEYNTGDVGLLTSNDGVTFTYQGEVMQKGTGPDLDAAGITEITLIELSGVLYMLYTGWTGTPPAYTGFYVLKATSTDWGRTWTKTGRLDPTGNIGLQHTCIVSPNPGDYRIFYGIDATFGADVGLWEARSTTPHGTYTEQAGPIMGMGTQAWEGDGLNGGFPAVCCDPSGEIWMLYTGVNTTFQLGLAEYRT